MKVATLEEIHRLQRELAAAHVAGNQTAIELTERAEAQARELDRWRHGVPVEGDYVCDYALEAEQLSAELEASRRDHEAEDVPGLLREIERLRAIETAARAYLAVQDESDRFGLGDVEDALRTALDAAGKGE